MTNVVFRRFLTFCLLGFLPFFIQAGERKNELLISWGNDVPHIAHQQNSQVALDYNFYEFRRSQRSGISLGMGYTHLWTDAVTDKNIEAFSFYPQLTLWPVRQSLHGTYFFVRALGPTYLSDNQLGQRQQAHHFAFQAQVGIGYRKQLVGNNAMLLQLSWKHFSNANLFDDNESIEVPFILSLGFAF